MRFSGSKKVAAVSFSTAAIIFGSAFAASGIGTATNFSSIVPRFQQSHYWPYQNKTTGNPSAVTFGTIGGGYLMNVKSQNGGTGVIHTERKGLAAGPTYAISNPTPRGVSTRLIVTNHSWIAFDVLVTGSFTTN